MTFAEKLRELRESREWSQGELADKSGASQQAIANWEKGDRVPAFDAVQSLCLALGVPCTVFDGCEHAMIENPRPRGRPKKAEPAPESSKPALTAKQRKALAILETDVAELRSAVESESGKPAKAKRRKSDA